MAERDQSLHVLQHALGLDDYGRGDGGRHPFNAYRNHFVTGDAGASFDLCTAHVDSSRMERHGPSPMYGGDGYCFTVTDAGREYVRDTSPKPPKSKRSAQRYREWLRVSDVYPDLTFGDWLKGTRP